MNLPVRKLDEMYWMGYCEGTIQYAAHKATTGEERVIFLEKHVGECTDCQRANLLKSIEAIVALVLGRPDLFEAGKELTHLPGYSQTMRFTLQEAKNNGRLTEEDQDWINDKALRYGQPWPGRLD